MRKILINMIGQEAPSLSTSGLEKQIEQQFSAGNSLTPIDLNEIDTFISTLNSNDEPLLISILAHGGKLGLVGGAPGRIEFSYKEIFELVSRCRTKNRLVLNLIGACNTFNSLSFKTEKHRIDEIWISNDVVSRPLMSLMASRVGDFNSFSAALEDEAGLYSLIAFNIT